MTLKEQEEFLSFATAFHEFKKEIDSKHGNIEKIAKGWKEK